MFSDQNRKILELRGLKVVENEENISIIKPIDVAGNALPYNKPYIVNYGHEDIETDYLVINIVKRDEKLNAVYWEWTPGPGPGDFDIDFNNEDEVITFIIDYYFNDNNKLFEARRDYEIQFRKSINVNDIKAILEKLTQQLDNEFSNSEIIFGERGTYNKVPPDSWRITQYQEEETMINAKMGFLNFEVAKLRKKVQEKKTFDFEDINNISSLVFELSLLLRDK